MANFFTRNTALTPPQWFYLADVQVIDKITGLFKWEVLAALSRDEVKKWYYSTPRWPKKLEDEEWVNHDFSMIHEKDEIIKKLKD